MSQDKRKYKTQLVGDIYKTLPIYEGESLDKKTSISPSQAYENYLKHLIILETEMEGMSVIYDDSKLDQMLIIVRGMSRIGVGEHKKVKTCTFHLIKLCESIDDGKI